MKLRFFRLIRGVVLGWALIPASALACEPEQDGCLGCDDDELPVCLQAFVAEICQASGTPLSCDAGRAYDDAERYVLISTGSHMSRVRSMIRSSRKYQLR
ncbi:MAG: hypothetical protein WBP44_05570 [Gammaproteobacteria bacterium]|jgi:hypothetical protein